jgi:hypothetical protein
MVKFISQPKSIVLCAYEILRRDVRRDGINPDGTEFNVTFVVNETAVRERRE